MSQQFMATDRNPAATNSGRGGGNIGRWTEKEQTAFVDGLRKYGKNWKKISQMVKTRSLTQIRTHAQKYFKKADNKQAAAAAATATTAAWLPPPSLQRALLPRSACERPKRCRVVRVRVVHFVLHLKMRFKQFRDNKSSLRSTKHQRQA